MGTKDANKQKMIETVETKLPDFVKMVKTTGDKMIIFHQHAFAADYQDEEFSLLGMAIKYAGLYNREITIVQAKD